VPVAIREITSEVVLGPDPGAEQEAPPPGGADETALLERVVRAATERVLERLRLEWGA
jgi:hypothetical protein